MKSTYEKRIEDNQIQSVCSDLKNKIYGRISESNKQIKVNLNVNKKGIKVWYWAIFYW